MEGFSFEAGEGRLHVFLKLLTLGNDLVVLIGGGEKPHVGAVSLAEKEGESVSVKTLVSHRHKEGKVASKAAKEITGKVGVKTVVIAGIHIEKAEKQEIKELLNNVDELINELILTLKKKF